MKRMVVSAGLASLAIFLTGCMQWQTVGTVDMSNVMTPAQVWEKQDSLIGKVVTIVLDTVISPLTGGRFLPTGEDYSVTGFHLNERYYRADDHVRAWRTHIDSVGRENARGDTIFTGDYEVLFVYSRTEEPEWPGWIKDPPRYFRLNIDSLENQRRWEALPTRPKKYMCGVLLGCKQTPSEIAWLDEFKDLRMYKDFRDIVLMPLGYRFKKKPDIPLQARE